MDIDEVLSRLNGSNLIVAYHCKLCNGCYSVGISPKSNGGKNVNEALVTALHKLGVNHTTPVTIDKCFVTYLDLR